MMKTGVFSAWSNQIGAGRRFRTILATSAGALTLAACGGGGGGGGGGGDDDTPTPTPTSVRAAGIAVFPGGVPTTTIQDVDATSDVATSRSFSIANLDPNGLAITEVRIELADAILPNLIFDRNGPVGDDDGKDFTVNSAPSGLAPSASFGSDSLTDGDTVLTVTMGGDGLQAEELLEFSIDVDPISIQGATAPGANQAGFVSGLELIGSSATFTFSDDSTRTVDLFAGPADEDGNVLFPSSTENPDNILLTASGAFAGDTEAGDALTVAPTGGNVSEISDLPSSQGQTAFAITDPDSDLISINVTGGPANTDIVVVVTETGGSQDNGSTTSDLPATVGNTALKTKGYFATLNGSGETNVNVPITVSPSDVTGASGVNVISVATVDSDGIPTSLVSNIVVVQEFSNQPVEFTSETAQSVDENSTEVFTLAVNDPDGDDSAITFDVADSGDGALFDVSSAGVVSFKTAPDFENGQGSGANTNEYVVTIEATDDEDRTSNKQFLVTVNDVASPVFEDTTPPAVVENTQEVFTVTTEGAATFSIPDGEAGGADGALFTISSGGALSFIAAPDFENGQGSGSDDNEYIVVVRATNAGEFADRTITVTVTDSAAPGFASSIINEQVKEGETFVANIVAVPENLGDAITYSKAGGAQETLFTVTSGGALSFNTAPDFENGQGTGQNNAFYEVIVQAAVGGQTATQTVNVEVLDDTSELQFTESQVDLSLSETFPDTGEPQTNIYNALSAMDNPPNGVKFRLGGADTNDLDIDEDTGQVSFVEQVNGRSEPDFENPRDQGENNQYRVTIIAELDGESASQNLVIDVEDVGPAITFPAGNTFQTPEGRFVAFTGEATPMQGSSGSLLWFTGGFDSGRLDGDDDGIYTFTQAPDFERPLDTVNFEGGIVTDGTFEIIIEVDDGIEQTRRNVSVTLTDVADDDFQFLSANGGQPLTNSNFDGFSGGASELVNVPSDASVLYDADMSEGGVTFSLVGGPEAGLLNINSSTGEVRFNNGVTPQQGDLFRFRVRAAKGNTLANTLTVDATITAATNTTGGVIAVTGGTGGAMAGASVSAPGDVDGDGLADVLIDAPKAGADGAAHVVFASSLASEDDAAQVLSLDAGLGVAITGAGAVDDQRSASAAGDVDGDGLGDLIIEDVSDTGEAQAYVVFGDAIAGASSIGALDLAGLTATGGGVQLDGGKTTGLSASAAGDVDGDGYADIAVRVDAPRGDGAISYILFGADLLTAKNAGGVLSLTDVGGSAPGTVISGGVAGMAAGGGGDVDRDTLGDVLVSQAGASSGVMSGAALAAERFVSGQTALASVAAAPASVTISDPSATGWTLAAAGDIDRDGFQDVLVSGESGVYALLGSTIASSGGTVSLADAADFGGAVRFEGLSGDINAASAGDVDGDDRGDILLGVPGGSNRAGAQSGVAYVVYGDAVADAIFAGSLDVTVAFHADVAQIDGVEAGDQLGASVSAAGDVDGDGLGDIIVGAPYAQANGETAGAAYIITGARLLVEKTDDGLVDLADLTAE